MVEKFTDRQAEAVRDKISWRCALGLRLTDAGFDFSILSEFRARLVAHGMEAKVLDLLVARLVARDCSRPVAGSAPTLHVLAVVRDLNRLELAGESVRAAVEAIAAVAPDSAVSRVVFWLR